MNDNDSEDIIINIQNHIGIILLNRPKALNALSLEMVNALGDTLKKWENDATINAVIIKGSGDRAFCAGGDIRSIYHLREEVKANPGEFFAFEYRMNTLLHHFKKPYISLLDGITMGGGVGISIHGSHRIATERLLFAMPETAIGFFPDVGAGYFLTRCPDYFGFYLGLTGERIGAADAAKLGLITHTVASNQLPELEHALIDAGNRLNNAEQLERQLNNFIIPAKNTTLWQHRDTINECFSAPTVADVLLKLEHIETDFAKNTLKTLLKRSPTSLAVTLKHLQLSQHETFNQIIEREYHIAQNFLRHHDFFEGVRAAVIDKGDTPQWLPARISDIDQATIEAYFIAHEAPLELQ